MKECCIRFLEACIADDWNTDDLNYCGYCGGKLDEK